MDFLAEFENSMDVVEDESDEEDGMVEVMYVLFSLPCLFYSRSSSSFPSVFRKPGAPRRR